MSKIKFLCYSIFFTVLISSLIVQSATACTGIMLRNKDGTVVHGRTVEFGIIIPVDIVAVPRNYAFIGTTPRGDGMKYTTKYAAVGIIGFDDVKIMDGLNEAGLSVGAFYFPTFAEYTPLTSENQNRALSPNDFPNWLLTQFATVAEVRQALEGGAAVIVPTVLKGWGPDTPPFHWIVYDKTGASLVIEPINGRLVLRDDPIGTLTNSPDFDWHMINLRNYISLDPRNVPPVKIAGETLKPLGQGSGMHGLPGDFTPPSRFVRAAVFSATAIPSDNSDKGIQQVFHILNNFDIPVGVAREEANGVIHSDFTQITTARDPFKLRYYYKTYDDQTLRMVDLQKFDLDAKRIKKLSTQSQQPVVDMSNEAR